MQLAPVGVMFALDQAPDMCASFLLAAGFLSMDTDGRVVRVDTLAKLLGPGFRLGWLSGPPPLVAKLALYMAGISIGANMVSQVRPKIIWLEVVLFSSTVCVVLGCAAGCG